MSAPRGIAVRLPRGDRESALLAARVAACVPVTQPAFQKLLGLLDIRASREVPTACVTLGARSRLLLNPDFVREHCHTEADLRMLVMHELLHLLLGHTRLHKVVTPAQNWAFDALINAQLCQLFPDSEEHALFRRLYDAERFPEALLRPPPGWRTPRERWPLKGTAGQAHRALYSERQLTETELFALLERGLDGAVTGTSRLLGDHSPEEEGPRQGRPGKATPRGEGVEPADVQGGEATQGEASRHDEGEPDPEFVETVRRIIAEWPMVERRGGRDQGGERYADGLTPRSPRRQAVAVIRRALWPLLDRRGGAGGPLRRESGTTDGLLPLRTPRDRRAAVRELLGETPLLYRHPLEQATLVPCERVHLYLDVSGSMDPVLPLLYGALAPLLDRIHPQVHLFSTRVFDVDLTALRRGRVLSTGGTSIDCVTGHLIREKVRRALILTDGWVGQVPETHRRPLGRARIGVVLTAGGDPDFAREMGWRTRELPELEERG